jgi:hypothetical protein
MKRFLTALLALVCGVPLAATIVVPADLAELTQSSLAVARGQVVSVEGRWTDDRRSIETVVTLATESYLKGGLGNTVQFRVPGGSLGRFRKIVVGAPTFAVGERVIVFLGTVGPSVPHVLGLNQGVFRVARDSGGAWIVTPPPVLPSPLGPVTRGSVSRRPAPLGDFEREVRALAAGAR